MKNTHIRIRSVILIFVLFMSFLTHTTAHAQTLEPAQDVAIKDDTASSPKTDQAVDTVATPTPPIPSSTVSTVKSDSREPVIKTEKTPYGNSVTIIYPENYSGEVSTSFENGQWKTTTKQYTAEDLQKMQDSMKKRQEALQKYFEAQQKFFQDMWSNWPKFPVFPF